MRYLSLCSGIEAASVAWADDPLNWEPAGFAEIEPFPCAVLKHHYPEVPNLGDITAPDFIDHCRALGPVDVIVGGPPCFPVGTLVLSRRGLLSIEQIVVGDEVFTHRLRWRKVLAVGNRRSETVLLKGQGASGIRTTKEHPFYARTYNRAWANEKRGWNKIWDSPEWIEARNMQGKFWGTPTVFPPADPPTIEVRGNEKELPAWSPAMMWILGAWLGNGWTRTGKRKTKGAVLICDGKDHADPIAEKLAEAGFRFSSSIQRTTIRFSVTSFPLVRFLDEHFGSGANNKTIPAWILGLSEEYRRSFLDGYIFADGCPMKTKGRVAGFQWATTSKALAVGVQMLCHTLGVSTVQGYHIPTRECIIEGRRVNERPQYSCRAFLNPRSSTEMGGIRWGKVKSVAETGQVETVYNIEVEEDNSYTADGLIVHNCQAFSVAGLRESLDDARGNLTLRYLEIVNALNPAFALYENVPGLLNTHDNAFGCFLAGLAGAEAPLVPTGKRGRWSNAGVVVGPQRRLAWRILDAQYFKLAQRRRRVFVVACPRNGADPAEILFESEGVQRYTDPRPKKRQSPAADAPASVTIRGRGDGRNIELGEPELANCLLTPNGGCDGMILAPSGPEAGCLTGWDGQLSRIHSTDAPAPPIAASDGSGGPITALVPEGFALIGHGEYAEGLPSLRAKGGDCAGGSEALIPRFCMFPATRPMPR